MAIGLTGVIIGVVGIMIFSPGCYGMYWTGKRAFERRNKAGVQEFDSYGKAVGATALESIISIVSVLAIAFGFLLFCIGLAFF